MIEVKQPFDHYMKPLDEDLVEFNRSLAQTRPSNSTALPRSGSSGPDSTFPPDGTKFVPLAVLQLAKPAEHVRALLTNVGITVVMGEPPAGAFPPHSFLLSVPEESKGAAISVIRKDAPLGKYWIQLQP